jgi:excisionase family DNA binding protein
MAQEIASSKNFTDLNKNVVQLIGLMQTIQDKPMSLRKAAEYLGVEQDFLYKLNSRKEIPYSKPGGKMVFYLTRDLDIWAKKNRVASQEELERGSENE